MTSDQLGGQPLQLLGVDPFAEAPFRSYVANDVNQPGGGGGAPAGQLTAFLTQPGAILLSSDVADRYGLQAGSPITLTVGGYQRPAFVAGLLDPADSLSRRALDGMLLADIATAQELTGRLGELDRIDVILPEDDPAALQRLEALLPEQASIVAGRRTHRHDRADDRRIPHQPDRAQPAGAGGGAVPDLQHHDLLGRAAPAALRHPALPGRHPQRGICAGAGRGLRRGRCSARRWA